MAVPVKVPRRFFRKRDPESIPRWKQTRPQTSTITFGSAVARRSMYLGPWKDTIEEIRQVSKWTHIDRTMERWAWWKNHGRLTPDVAIITDGSLQKQPKNVDVFGEIIIAEPVKWDYLYDAVLHTMDYLRARAPRVSGDYWANIRVLANMDAYVPPAWFANNRETLNRLLQDEPDPDFTIVANMPYSAKIERQYLPQGMMYGAWKSTRSTYGAFAGVEFRYFTAEQIPINQHTGYDYKRTVTTTGRGPKASADDGRVREQYQAGKPLSFPAIRIGQLGTVQSKASRVIIKARGQKIRQQNMRGRK